MSDFIDFLKTRRSAKLSTLVEPGPSSDQLQDILTVASRVPDHGKYAPWYFIVFEGDARYEIGQRVRDSYKAENPDAAPAKLELEAERFLQAPLVVAVVSRIKPGKHAEWEQVLSAGAACMNLGLAANALGFGTNWLTPWYSYSPVFLKSLGLDDKDRIAGFIFIGTETEKQEERERPALENIVTYWQPDVALNKGDEYPVTKLPV